jgi:hypothetical protein
MALITRIGIPSRSTAEIYGAAFGSIATVILADIGNGVWSLVFGNLMSEVVLTSSLSPSATFNHSNILIKPH